MNAVSEGAAGDGAKAAAEPLVLRARPRPIARFRRWLLIGGIGFGAASLSALAWVALSASHKPPSAREAQPTLAANGGEETLSMLPKDYAQSGAPRLGPPLPGDLGRAIVGQQEREGTAMAPSPALTPAQQAAEQERQRLAAEALAARTSALLAQTSMRAMPVVEDVMSAAPVSPLVDGQGMPPGGDQEGKRAFLQERLPASADNSGALTTASSPYQVMAGAVIPAALLTGLNSDLPGLVTAQVSENVYDTVTGRYLLIPQGSRLIGLYDSKVAFGQRRALVVWNRLILPDGASIKLDNLQATDAAGYAGLEDQVDIHGRRMAGAIAMSTLLGVGSELSLDGGNDIARALQRSAQQSTTQAGQQLVGKQLDVQPTLRIRPGWPLRVIVHRDLTLRPWRNP